MKKFILIILILSGFGNTVGNNVKRGTNNNLFVPYFQQHQDNFYIENDVVIHTNSLDELEHNLLILEQKLELISTKKSK